jgi:hypothetical protein
VVSGILVGVFVVNLVETAAVVQWRSKSGVTFFIFLGPCGVLKFMFVDSNGYHIVT